ncbi:MAG: WYL domain-containing protein [Oscillospiraceae bacterium]|nr:WYL domain-containing protein [Oscillospiraceae bacterium]
MIFNEIYSAYYNTVAKILAEILKGNTSEKNLNKIISENAFGESILNILPSLKNEKWQIVRSDLTTPIKHMPTMPLTTVQKQWLKAISQDPRIKLFDFKINGLEDTEPLFSPDDYVIYDKYSDGDPYDDEKYIAHFRTILKAMQNKQSIKIEMTNRKGRTVCTRCAAERLEYSEKDDKFRLVTSGCHFIRTINIARITKCSIYNGEAVLQSGAPETDYDYITLKVSKERNTLERCMLHFAHFEKRAEKNDGHYFLHIKFDKNDEPEMVIRVLSFGPTVEVVGSESFKKLIIDKLICQKNCGLL